MEPLLVAEVDGQHLLVDGHHRLEAYRLAGRTHVPVRVLRLGRMDALMVSKLVNFGGEKLPMHVEQAREAVWQYLAHVTLRGRRGLPQGQSLRTIAARFGDVAKSTVARMLERLSFVDLSEFDTAALDAGTGWPRWRHVRGNAWRDCFSDVPLETRRRAQAIRLAKRIASLMDEAGPEVSRMATALLLAERKDECSDLLDKWRDVEEGANLDY